MRREGDILFVEPPPTLTWRAGDVVSTAGRRHPSLNVTGERVYSYLNLSSAAVLRERGFGVRYIHCQTLRVDMKSLEGEIERLRPAMLVVQAEHINLGAAKEVARMAEDAGSFSVFVGPLVTALDEEFARDGVPSFVVRGEWDYTVSNLAAALKEGRDPSRVPGLTFMDGSRLIRTEDAPLINDLDSLPFPAYDLVDLAEFYESVFIRFPAATMITSRGCPHRCVFCVFPNTIYSHRFRPLSPERVVAEVKHLVERFGVRQIRFDDDTFEVDRRRALEICRLLKKENLDLVWLVQSRPSSMDPELCRRMRDAGCVMVLFGVESGDDGVLKKIRKGTTVEEIRRGVKVAKDSGLEVLNCIMLGFYWDTPDTVKRSLDLAFELDAEFTQFSIPTPLPGTSYFELLKEKGLLGDVVWEEFDSFHRTRLDLPHLTADEIMAAIRWAYRRYYTRPGYVLKMGLRALKSPDHLRQSLRLAWAYLSRLREGWL